MHKTEYSPVVMPAGPGEVQLKVYPRRWLILAVFMLYCIVNNLHWVQYTIVADLVARFYDMPVSRVDWTSFIFMATIVFLILPGSFIADRMGMRWSLMLGSALMMAGAWLKILGVAPDRYFVVLIGQVATGISQVFMVGMPPKVAAIWFHAQELSTACAMGVLGSQLGAGIGLLLPPIVVRPHDDPADIGKDLSVQSYILAGLSTATMVLVAFLFKAQPKLPPSPAQALERASATTISVRTFCRGVGRLLCNRNFLLLFLANSICNGLMNLFITVLNIVVLRHFPDGQEFAGRVGLVIIVFGMVGCVVYGVLLDRTHMYKEMTLIVYGFMAVACATFGYALSSGSAALVYFMAAMLGLSLMGFVTVPFELGAELTYPASESAMASLLLIPGNVLGIVMTMVFTEILQTWGDFWAFTSVCCCLVLGAFPAVMIQRDYRRLAANTAGNHVSLPAKQEDCEKAPATQPSPALLDEEPQLRPSAA